MEAMPCTVVFFAVSLATVCFVVANPPAIVTTAGYLNSESERVQIAGWIEVLFGVSFDENERRCAAEDKIYFQPKNECFRLFHRGPCKWREWLVFDKDAAAAGKLTAVCKRQECSPKWGYDARTNKCFQQSQCASPTAFHYTLFGEGECRCNGITAPGMGDPTCRELFHAHSCSAGMILAPRYRLIEGMDSTCTSDPCLEEVPDPGDPGSNPLLASSNADISTRRGLTEGKVEVDVRLSVQLSDGKSLCHTPAQLNVMCELRMVPLFSDLSNVKVPLCVNTRLRHVIWQPSRNRGCVVDDKGRCAKTVVIKKERFKLEKEDD